MKTLHVSDLGKIITGNTPPRSQPDLYGNYIPFIKATDITEGQKYTREPEEYYSERGYAKYKRSLIPAGATCVVTIGSIGKKMTMACCDCFINQAMNAVIPNKSFDAEYIYYALKFYLPKLKILDSGTASGRENVSKNAFSNMEIDIIEDYETQKTIGRILSTYDNLIENNQKQIKLLEEAAQRLYKEWFIDLRFPGHENTPIHDGLPEGWRIGTLDEIAIDSGKTEKKENRETYRYYLPIDCLPKESLAYTVTNDISLAESSLISFVPGDILFGAMRPYFHKVVVARDCGLTRSTCFVINAKEDSFWSYLTMLLFSKETIDYATKISVGTTMPYVRWKDFQKMIILIPSNNVSIKFNEIIKPVIERINYIANSIIKANQLRDDLLPQLMNGKLEI